MSLTGLQACGRVAVVAWALAGCAPPDPTAEPLLQMSADQSSIDGRTQRAIVRFRAFDAKGAAGVGVVQLSAPIGAFVEGDSVELKDGVATAAYRCNPQEIPACAGDVRLGATWSGATRTILMKVGPTAALQPVRFRVESTGTQAALNAAVVATDGTVWAAGENGTLLRYTAPGWQQVPVPTSVELLALTALPGGRVAAAGRLTIVVFADAQSASSVIQGDGQDDFTGLCALNATELVAVTDSGRVARWDGSAFQFQQLTQGSLGGVGGRTGALWAFGPSELFHADATGWHAESAPVFASWRRLTTTGDSVWLIGRREDASGENIIVEGPEPQWRSIGSSPLTLNDFTLSPQSTEQLAVADTDVLRREGSEAWTSLGAPAGGRAIISRFKGDLIVVGQPGFSVHRAP